MRQVRATVDEPAPGPFQTLLEADPDCPTGLGLDSPAVQYIAGDVKPAQRTLFHRRCNSSSLREPRNQRQDFVRRPPGSTSDIVTTTRPSPLENCDDSVRNIGDVDVIADNLVTPK